MEIIDDFERSGAAWRLEEAHRVCMELQKSVEGHHRAKLQHEEAANLLRQGQYEEYLWHMSFSAPYAEASNDHRPGNLSQEEWQKLRGQRKSASRTVASSSHAQQAYKDWDSAKDELARREGSRPRRRAGAGRMRE